MASRPLPLEQLIGAPLRSLVLGQGIAAQATAEFVAEVGFTPTEGTRPPTVRTFDFTYLHPVPDPANPGSVIDTPTQVSVPLLSFVGIPNLRIAEATVNFAADVVDVKPIEARPTEVDLQRKRAISDRSALLPGRVQMVAAYAPPNPPEGSVGSALSFSIRVVGEPAPEGLANVLNLLNESIRSRTEGKR
jgi:uncharacterized protein DUF2589